MSNKNKEILQADGSSELINVGHGNFVRSDRVVVILESGPLPVRRLREQAAEGNRLLDASGGKKMRSLIVTDTNHVVISGLASTTLQERLRVSRKRHFISPAELELQEGEFIS